MGGCWGAAVEGAVGGALWGLFLSKHTPLNPMLSESGSQLLLLLLLLLPSLLLLLSAAILLLLLLLPVLVLLLMDWSSSLLVCMPCASL